MKRFVLLSVAVLIAALAASDTIKERAEIYIGKYSSIAVGEMHRSGIPASVTLAQGLLESGYGMSPLAVEGNNHFGIKCHSDWTGEHINVDDDLKNECFRKYAAAEESYRDHSDFLRFKQRYAFLFDYEITDYKSWAYGLKKAGYATDPEYAPKLIRIIETYDLGRFDRDAVAVSESVASSGQAASTAAGQGRTSASGSVSVATTAEKAGIPDPPSKLEQPERYVGTGKTGTFVVSLQREILALNGVPFVYAREGETYRSIAASYDLFPGELASFNDRKDPDTRLVPGETVYLQQKAKTAARGLDKHICNEGETLYDISQRYAVRLKELMKMNGISRQTETLREDRTLYLRANRK